MRKIAVCARHGLVGLTPLNDQADHLECCLVATAWERIYHQNLALMESSDVLIVKLTPFRGASADAGTLVELGWFLARGRPIFGYSNQALTFSVRSRMQVEAVPDPVPELAIEEFDLPDNLMVAGALLGSRPIVVPDDGQERAFHALDLFERCVTLAAASLGLTHPLISHPHRNC